MGYGVIHIAICRMKRTWGIVPERHSRWSIHVRNESIWTECGKVGDVTNWCETIQVPISYHMTFLHTVFMVGRYVIQILVRIFGFDKA